MGNQKQQSFNDPELLTHYLGNDEYEHGNKLMNEEDDEDAGPDGFSAEGNGLTEESEDPDSDKPEVLE